jgi:hypothetical protein
LINAISESFPSVQNSDNVFWTRNINWILSLTIITFML